LAATGNTASFISLLPASSVAPFVKLPEKLSDGSLPRAVLVKRLVSRGVTVQGPEQYRILSTAENILAQPLKDPVPRDVVRTIARAFNLPIEALYFDTIEGDED
jgi:hypothetical protein